MVASLRAVLVFAATARALQGVSPRRGAFRALRPLGGAAGEAGEEEGLGRQHFIRDIIEGDLKEKKHGTIVTRFPPEPNGFLHLGHAKSICVNFGLARDYSGRTHMRLDDTNPEKEQRIFGESILEDVRWLVPQSPGPGGNDPWYGEVRHASDYFDVIWAVAKVLVSRGDAYVDSQSPEEMRAKRGTLTSPGVDSPHRERSAAENLELLEGMRNGSVPEGRCVLRAKIDMASPNLNLRDPALYRVKAGKPHPRTGAKWRVYPMYDFAHAVSDAYEGITHSLCTLEFEDHRPLYDWVVARAPEVRDEAWVEAVYRAAFDDFDGASAAAPEALDDDDAGAASEKTKPRQIEFSRLNVAHTVMSKRKLAKLVEDGAVDGWDDPRLPTLAALRRKGVPPAALALFCERVGVSKADSLIDPELVDDAVREVLDATAPRAFGVLNPLKVTVADWTPTDDDHPEALEAPRHPKDDALGVREGLRFGRDLVIERSDFHDPETEGEAPKGFNRLVPGGRVRLRYAYVVRCDDVRRDETGQPVELVCSVDYATRAGAKGDGPRVKGIVHWLRADDAVPADVRLYDRLFSAPKPSDGDDALNPGALVRLEGALVERDVLTTVANDTRAPFQLERVGYFCVDAPGSPARPPPLDPDAPLVLNRIAPLKDTFAGPKRASAKKAKAAPAEKKKKGSGLPDDLPKDAAAAALLDLRVGTITSAAPHDEADALWCTTVDCGEGEERTIGAGLRAHYDTSEDLVGSRVVLLANTKPRNLAGYKSMGMLLTATDGAKTTLLAAPDSAKNGDRATFAGLPAADPATPNQMNNKKLWQTAQPTLAIQENAVTVGGGAFGPLAVDGAPVVADADDGASVA